MKISLLASTVLFLALLSCDNSKKKEKEKQEIPKALQDKNSSSEIVFKRRDGDLVESLYNELADKTPELKQLENKIDDIRISKKDSIESFENYNSKNESYFNAANRHAEQIKDSVLRDKIKVFIAAGLTKYNSSIARHNVILKSIETKTLTLNDLHTILKIVRTLPVIAKYQKDNLPPIKSLEGFSKQLDETIKYADTLSKK